MSHKTGVYVGPRPELKGKVAAIREGVNGRVLVQFELSPPEMNENNDGGPLNHLCFNWHPFQPTDFEIQEPVA